VRLVGRHAHRVTLTFRVKTTEGNECRNLGRWGATRWQTSCGMSRSFAVRVLLPQSDTFLVTAVISLSTFPAVHENSLRVRGVSERYEKGAPTCVGPVEPRTWPRAMYS